MFYCVLYVLENPFNGIESKELAQDKKLRKRLRIRSMELKDSLDVALSKA